MFRHISDRKTINLYNVVSLVCRVAKIVEKYAMEEKEVARTILSHRGLTFDKSLIHQDSSQNFINGLDLFKRNALNLPSKAIHELAKGYPTLGRPSSPYTDSLTNLDSSKTDLKFNTTSSFEPTRDNAFSHLSRLSNLGISMNNPYFYNFQETVRNQNEIGHGSVNFESDDGENIKFLTLLNDLKTLYTGPSFTDKINESRSKKLDTLIDYFSNSNDENDLRLDKKGCLVYKNLSTNTKFAVYVDYFLKYPNEVQSKSRPLYFDELFLDKISKTQTKFNPTVRHESSRTAKRRKNEKREKRVRGKRYSGTRTDY